MVDDGADVRVVDGRRRRRRRRHGRISRMSCKMSGHDDEQWRRRMGLARPAFAQPYGPYQRAAMLSQSTPRRAATAILACSAYGRL